jgi:serine/threonine protein kinase/tetratricopeptide (TPR) repeat protein
VADQFARFKTAIADQYAIEGELGRGGMAVVYRAHDPKHDRVVAIKVLKPELALSIGADRFLREIQIAAKLSHPHILTLIDSGQRDGYLYSVMPYVEGESLRQRLDREPRLPIDEALRITREVGAALGYAHKHGVVHRDIKPGNILLSAGVAVVTDFGIARAVSEAATDQLTDPGIAVGTPTYMSPEQASGEQQLDGRSDVYSLGCVLFEMLAGEPPYTGSNPQAILARKSTQPMPSIHLIRKSVAPSLERVIAKALARHVADRFGTAGEFADSLASPSMAMKASDSTPEGAVAVRTGPSVAVLPFANVSAEAENEFFSDGIAEEITNALAKIKALHVAARTSAFAFKGRSGDVRKMGDQLGVGSVLEGSVRRSGNRIRITAQLVSVADGYHLWSERYDREMEDVFAVQDEIARSIAAAVGVVLSEEEQKTLARVPTGNVTAYEYFLRGRQHFRQLRRKTLEYAREMFRKAIEIDPDYALAYAGIADCSSFLAMYFDPSEANLAEADAASRRALELDPDLPEAHAVRGLAFSLNDRYEEAEQEFKSAIMLDPTLFEAHYFYARSCVRQGRHREAARLFEQACEAREDHQARLLWAQSIEGMGAHEEAQRAYRKALAVLERHLELEPGDGRALTLGGIALIRLGQLQKAEEWTERALAIDPEDAVVLYAAACNYSVWGRKERALDLLATATQNGFGQKDWIANDPDLDNIRGEPRFQTILEQA